MGGWRLLLNLLSSRPSSDGSSCRQLAAHYIQNGGLISTSCFAAGSSDSRRCASALDDSSGFHQGNHLSLCLDPSKGHSSTEVY